MFKDYKESFEKTRIAGSSASAALDEVKKIPTLRPVKLIGIDQSLQLQVSFQQHKTVSTFLFYYKD